MILELLRSRKEQKPNGPHGLDCYVGDPDDLSLRKVELEILIPQKMRDRAKAEKCAKEVTDFHECCRDNGITVIINCRKENSKMKECLTYWYQNSEFKQECTEEYLKERSEYRRTGIGLKQRLAAAAQRQAI